MLNYFSSLLIQFCLAAIISLYLSGCVPITPIPTGDDSVVPSPTSLDHAAILTETVTTSVKEVDLLTPEPTISALSDATVDASGSPTTEPAHVDTTGGRIEVRAVGKPSGVPISGLEISLNPQDDAEDRIDLDTSTDENGSYLFAKLEPGVYSISLAWNLTKYSPTQCDNLSMDTGLDGSWLSITGENKEGEKILVAVGPEITIDPAEILQLNFEFECR